MIDPRGVLIGKRVRLWGVWMALVFLLGGCLQIGGPGEPPVVPLDSLLRISFKDMDGHLHLNLRTERFYEETGGYGIAATVVQRSKEELLVEVQGVRLCNVCPADSGYASSDIQLPDVSGVITLTLAYPNIDADTYTLYVNDDSLYITMSPPPLFTHPERFEWRRLPRGSTWILVSNAGVPGPYPQHFYADRDEYRRQLERFSADLEKLGIERFWPEDGYYTNQNYLPPLVDSWSHQGQSPHFVPVPMQDYNARSYNMPILWHFIYNGEWDSITALIDAYQDSDLGITAYNWRGDDHGTGRRAEVTATPWPTPVPSVLSTPSPLATP